MSCVETGILEDLKYLIIITQLLRVGWSNELSYNWMNCILHNLDIHSCMCMCFLSGGTLIKSIYLFKGKVSILTWKLRKETQEGNLLSCESLINQSINQEQFQKRDPKEYIFGRKQKWSQSNKQPITTNMVSQHNILEEYF